MTFVENEWIILPDDQVRKGRSDWGGIWVAATKGGANKLRKYMEKEKGVDCRIFITRIGEVLYENSYRIKTDRVFLEEEIE